jgi:Skp family chaperone for outer membrane proteins
MSERFAAILITILLIVSFLFAMSIKRIGELNVNVAVLETLLGKCESPNTVKKKVKHE